MRLFDAHTHTVELYYKELSTPTPLHWGRTANKKSWTEAPQGIEQKVPLYYRDAGAKAPCVSSASFEVTDG